MQENSNNYTVNTYLIKRLQEAGVEHIFGVPGDYNLDFLDQVITSPLKWIGNCNELNAGYAADGYARVKGLGAVVVTYGVGGFSVLNAAAGAYAEQVPLIIISGAPHSVRRQANALVHHLTKDYMLQYDIYKKVTVDSAMLINPQTAPDEIDRVIRACIHEKRPVYLELPLDVGQMPCREPQPIDFKYEMKSNNEILDECVEETIELLNNAENPVVLVGVELLRFGLTQDALKLVEHLELPFASTVSSKSALPELHPQFMGLYQGSMSKEKVKKQIETSDCVLSLGVWLNDFDTGGFTAYLQEKNMINANSEQIKIKRHSYSHINMKDYIKALIQKAKPRTYLASHPAVSYTPKETYIPENDKPLEIPRFYTRLNNYLKDDMILIAEPGDAICAAPELQIEEADNFIAQAYYLSIGYCTPASLGVSLAKPEKRVVLLTGDGAFQMTAQEISTILRYMCNPIIFLNNNDGYLIERMLHQDGYYNDIQQWNYYNLPSVFSSNAIGVQVKTEGDLENALALADKEKDKMIFIELLIKNNSCSEGLKRLGDNFKRLNQGK